METKIKTYTGYGSLGGYGKEISMPKNIYDILSKYELEFMRKCKSYILEYHDYSDSDENKRKFKKLKRKTLNYDKVPFETYDDYHYQWIVYNDESLYDRNNDKPHLKFITSQLRSNWDFGSERKQNSYLFKIAITKDEAKILRYEYRNIYNYFRNLKYSLINQ